MTWKTTELVLAGGWFVVAFTALRDGVQSAADTLREWWWAHYKPTGTWTVTLIDPDGIPMRREKVSAKGAARILDHINNGFIK